MTPQKKILALALAALAALSMAPIAQAGPRLDKIMEAKVLRVGTPGDYRPFAIKNDGGYAGHDIDVVEAMAKELGAEGIRVNCIAPGWVESEMTAQAAAAIPPESLAEIMSRHVLGIGKTIDVANSIAFFLADTGRWITGTTLVVDGGCTIR